MNTRSPITTHILDISRGKAASGVPVVLEQETPDGAGRNSAWQELARGTSNSDGRVEGLLKPGSRPEAGNYRLTFDTSAYYKTQGLEGFYPFVTVAFVIRETGEHYHVPLLLSPCGYSTYRGT